jgi:hypothetical protein
LPRIEIQTRQHPRYGWVMARFTVGASYEIAMVINLGVPRSSISTATRQELIMKELVPPRAERGYTLTDLTVHGQPLPPLQVRVSGALGLIGAGGIIDLDFFGQYEDIHFHVPTLRLTLSGP